MAWRDQYHYLGYLYSPPMEVVYQSKIASFTYLSFQNVLRHIFGAAAYVIQGDINNVASNMTVIVGSAPGLDDHGRARIIDVVTSTHDLVVWAPIGIHDGELNPSTAYYATVLNDYRVWMKAPYAAGGQYYFDGQQTPDGATYDQYPIANGGPGYCGLYDESTGIITVDFDASASFAVADDAQLGGLTSDLFGGAPTLTASEGTPANAIDGNTATYWAAPSAASNDGQYMHVDLGDGNDEAIRQMTITASTNHGPDYLVFQYSDDDSNWVTALYAVETSWTSHEQKTYDIHYTDAHRYWRLVVFNSTGGLPTYEPRIEEWELFGEDRTAGTSPYTWDVDDGSITVGSSTSESITATFPEGFRWVTLTVTDTNGEDGIHYIPVGAITYTHTATIEANYSGATITSSSQQGSDIDDNAFDNNTATKWTTTIGLTSGWIQIQFSTAQTVKRYGIDYTNISGGSYAHTIVVKGSNNGVDYDTLDTQTGLTWVAYQSFNIATPGSYTYYKMEMTGSGSYVGVAEWDLLIDSDLAATTGVIESAVVLSQTMEPLGQIFEFSINEALPTTTYSALNVEPLYTTWTATASSTNGGQIADYAFDNDNGTYWEATSTSARIGGNWSDGARSLYRYGVYAPGAADSNPRSWYFQGSDDGSSWTTLDTQAVQLWTGAEEKIYTLSEPASYEYFRLNVINTPGDPVRVYELNLYLTIYDPAYADGNLIMYFEREWYDLVEGSLSAAGVTDREHMRLVGWIDPEQMTIQTSEDGIEQGFRIQCIDVGQRLNQLADFTFMAQRDVAPSYGYEMKHANMDVYFYLMVRWLSTGAELADFIWSNTADHFNIGLLAAQGASVYDMINQRASGIDFMFTCNKNGQLKIVPDLRSCANEFRQNVATFETLTAADYSNLDYTYNRTPQYHWLYGSGVGFVPPVDADSGSFAVATSFTITPGQTPGQGVGNETEIERLMAESDLGDGTTAHQTTSIFERLGRSYAQKSAYWLGLTFDLVHAGDTGFDPAEAQWLKLTVPATLITYRPRPLTAAMGIIKRINIAHDHDSMTKTVNIEWEEVVTNYIDAWSYTPT